MALYDEAYVATQRARIRELEAELVVLNVTRGSRLLAGQVVELKARVAELIKLLESPCPFCHNGANEAYRVAIAREREEC